MKRNVVSLSATLPSWQDVRGKPVYTSIVREPIFAPLWFGPAGPDHNQTAVHTEHVLAFSAEHYDHWTGVFGVMRDQWGWAHWGENITLTGVDENTLRLGDQLRIGDGALFEVTSPRIPCFKLAWRIGQPDAVLADMVRKGWIGFYLRVLNPGTVRPGDSVEITSPYPDSITIGDLSRLLRDPAAVDVEALKAVMAMPALGNQATVMIRSRLRLVEDRDRLQAYRWQGWREFRVAELREETSEVRSFSLEPSDNQPLPRAKAGQFLTVHVPLDTAPVARNWSISDYVDEPTTYRVTIKKVSPAAASAWMHGRVGLGSQLLLRAPTGRFTLDRSGFLRVVLVSAGVGVTPLLSMLKAHVARDGVIPPLLWVHVTQSSETHLFRDEVETVLAAHSEFRRALFYSRPSAQDQLGIDFDYVGRPSSEILTPVLSSTYTLAPVDKPFDLGGEHSDFYVCGPASFEEQVREILCGMSVPATNIRSESFGGRATLAQGGVAIEDAEVRFTRSGITGRWHSKGDQTLLELAEALGLAPDAGCRLGVCGSCLSTLMQGKVSYLEDPAEPVEPGKLLLCCSQPASKLIEIDI